MTKRLCVSITGMIAAIVLLFSAAILCIGWLVSEVGRGELQRVREANQEELLEACRQLLKESSIQDSADGAKAVLVYRTSVATSSAVPQAIRSLKPYVISIRDKGLLTIKLSPWTHNYVAAFEEGRAGGGDLQLIEGLWFSGPTARAEMLRQAADEKVPRQQ